MVFGTKCEVCGVERLDLVMGNLKGKIAWICPPKDAIACLHRMADKAREERKKGS